MGTSGRELSAHNRQRYDAGMHADSSAAPTVDFLGIGVQKGGTTWLYHQLARHPQVAFPRG
jgi:hypothetical protein